MNTQNFAGIERKTFLLQEGCNADDLVKNFDEEILASEIAAVLANGNGTSKELSIAKNVVLRFVMIYNVYDDEKYSEWVDFLNEILEIEY